MRTGASRIIGVRVGEFSVDLIHSPDAVIKAEFALIRDDGAHCGKVSKYGDWSEETAAALKGFVESLEADIFSEVFQGPAPPPEADETEEKQKEPPQF